MIKLNKSNISRFTKRLQKSILDNINTDIKLNISRKIFAEIFGVQSIDELEKFLDKENKHDEIRENFIEESKILQKSSFRLLLPSNLNEIKKRTVETQSTPIGDINFISSLPTDKSPENYLELLEKLKKNNLSISEENIKNCRALHKEKHNTHYLDKFRLYELINEQFIYFCKFNSLEGIRSIMNSNEGSLQNFLDIFNYSLKEFNGDNLLSTYGYVAFTKASLEIQRYLLTGKYYINNVQYCDNISVFKDKNFSNVENIESFLFNIRFHNLNKFKYFYTQKHDENIDIFPFVTDKKQLLLDKFRMICHTTNKDNPLIFDFIIEELIKDNTNIESLLVQGLKWCIQSNNEKIIFSNVFSSIINFKYNNKFLFSIEKVFSIAKEHVEHNNLYEYSDFIRNNIESIFLTR